MFFNNFAVIETRYAATTEKIKYFAFLEKG